ncbi:DUF2948 family protein [Alphaproteobacteria bacterium]|nr:DUF2948 family protein [Alphaproteobacteria bacterium]
MSDNTTKNSLNSHLRLRAQDEDDLAVLSSLFQDAIIPGSDMHIDKTHKRFVIVANRFCWERPPLDGVTLEDGGVVHERVLCGMQIFNVEQVQQSGMPANRRDSLLNLLALRVEPLQAMADTKSANIAKWTISLLFSGNATIKLSVQEIDVIVEDIDLTRPTAVHPRHDPV